MRMRKTRHIGWQLRYWVLLPVSIPTTPGGNCARSNRAELGSLISTLRAHLEARLSGYDRNGKSVRQEVTGCVCNMLPAGHFTLVERYFSNS